MASATPLSYSVPQRIVHWLTVLLVFFNLIAESAAERVADLWAGGKTPTADELFSANLHMAVGLAVLALTVIRLVLRAVQGAPGAPADEPPLLQLVAKVTHGLLYLLLILMPVSGMMALYGGVNIAGVLHGGPMKLLLWLLVIGHVAARLSTNSSGRPTCSTG